MGWGQEAGSANHVSPSRHYSDSQPITSGLSRHISDSQPITSDSPAATATVSQSRQTPPPLQRQSANRISPSSHVIDSQPEY